MADKRISQLVERTTLANNDVLPIVASGASTTNKVTLQTIEDWMQGNLNFGVTSVAISVPTGLTVTGSPITSTGTFIIGFAAGYSIPTNTKQSEWDSAYNDKINSVAVTGTTTKTITLTQQDGGTLSAQWSDLQPVTSVFGRTGDVVAVEGDYSLDQLSGVGITSPSSGQVLKYDGTNWVNATEQYVGTVTSVGVSVPAAFSVTGSPITTSGTITISGAGTSAQYIDGTGSLQTFPNLIAQATNLVREVYNNSGATMTKGTVVYINGGHGNLPTIAKAKADADSTSAQTYGVVQANISDQSNGYIVVVGDLTNIDTQGYLEGTQLYLSGTTAGNYTSTKPYAPIHIVYVGIVTRSHPTQGIIAIKIQNGYEMDEIHDVDAQNPSDNDILQYKTATGLWTKTAGTTTNIAEGTNLYYTNERARQSISETITGIDYDNTTGVFSTTSGYGIPTTAKQTQWDAAYNDKINSASVSGTTTKTLTLTQQDGGTITTSWSDYDTAPVTSVFGRTGAIVATEGDYNLTQLGDVTITTPSNGQVLKYNGTTWVNDTGYVGTVTSVGLSVPTGLSVSGSPITTSGTLAISLESGYSIPTTASQTNWDAAYNDKINSAAVTGTTTKTLTLTQQDGGTITASWTDINTDAVTSVFGRTGAVVATEGDYTLTQLGDVTITTPTNGQFLKYDGTSWINAAAGTVTSVALATGTTGTDVGVTGSPITGAGTITLNIPVASATNTGKLSNTDWIEFNSKPYGSGNSNRIAYWNGVNSLAALDTATYPSLTELSYVKGVTSSIQTQLNNITGNYVTTNTNQDITARKTFRGDTGASLNFNNTANTFVGAISTYKDWFSGGTSTDLAIGAVANLYLFSNNGSNWAMKLDLNRDATFATKVKIDGGTSSQFLKANGDLDSTSYVPTSRTLTINGTAYDLTADRSWTITAGVTGSGTATYLPKWATGGTSLNDSSLRQVDTGIIAIKGSSTGNGNTSYLSFQNSSNIEVGWIGDGSSGNSDIYLSALTNNLRLSGSSIILQNDVVFSNYIISDASFANGYKLMVRNPSMSIDALQGSYFGYSSGYGVLLVGHTGTNNRSLAFGVDVSGNPSGGFSGWGNEYIWRNAASFITPNSSNNGYNTLLSWNSSGQVTINNLIATSLTLGNNIQIGDYSQATNSLTFAASANGIAKINFYDSNSTEGLYIRTDGESYGGTMTFGARWDDDEGKIAFKMYQVSAGGSYHARVGIGTTTPSTDLHIYGSNAILRVQGTNANDNVQLQLWSNNYYFDIINEGADGHIKLTADDNQDIVFYTDTIGASYERFRIGARSTAGLTSTVFSNSQVYIQSPSYSAGYHPLIVGNTGLSYLIVGYDTMVVQQDDVTTIRMVERNGGASANQVMTFSIGDGVGVIATSAQPLDFFVGGDPSGAGYTGMGGTRVLRMNTNGSAQFYYALAGSSDIYSTKNRNYNGYTMLTTGSSGGHLSQIDAKTENSSIGMYFNLSRASNIDSITGFTATGWRFTTDFTCSSGDLLQVMNNYNNRMNVNHAGTLTMAGDVIAYSDARLKTDVKTIEDALNKVLSLRGVSYNRTDIDFNKRKIGVIAQEIQKVIPEVVDETTDGTLGVAYGNMVGLLIEAVKEQQKQIEELKKQVA